MRGDPQICHSFLWCASFEYSHNIKGQYTSVYISIVAEKASKHEYYLAPAPVAGEQACPHSALAGWVKASDPSRGWAARTACQLPWNQANIESAERSDQGKGRA